MQPAVNRAPGTWAELMIFLLRDLRRLSKTSLSQSDFERKLFVINRMDERNEHPESLGRAHRGNTVFHHIGGQSNLNVSFTREVTQTLTKDSASLVVIGT